MTPDTRAFAFSKFVFHCVIEPLCKHILFRLRACRHRAPSFLLTKRTLYHDIWIMIEELRSLLTHTSHCHTSIHGCSVTRKCRTPTRHGMDTQVLTCPEPVLQQRAQRDHTHGHTRARLLSKGSRAARIRRTCRLEWEHRSRTHQLRPSTKHATGTRGSVATKLLLPSGRTQARPTYHSTAPTPRRRCRGRLCRPPAMHKRRERRVLQPGAARRGCEMTCEVVQASSS